MGDGTRTWQGFMWVRFMTEKNPKISRQFLLKAKLFFLSHVPYTVLYFVAAPCYCVIRDSHKLWRAQYSIGGLKYSRVFCTYKRDLRKKTQFTLFSLPIYKVWCTVTLKIVFSKESCRRLHLTNFLSSNFSIAMNSSRMQMTIAVAFIYFLTP